MNEDRKELLEQELDDLLDSLGDLSPESNDYKSTMEAIERIEKLLSKCENSKEVEELKRERDELKLKLNNDRSLLHDKQFILEIVKLLLKVTAFVAAMEWERIHVWTSRTYQSVKNLF